MKRIEVILKKHNEQMLTHHRLFLKGRTAKENMKVFNETIRAIEGYIEQQYSLMWIKCIDEQQMIKELDKWIRG